MNAAVAYDKYTQDQKFMQGGANVLLMLQMNANLCN